MQPHEVIDQQAEEERRRAPKPGQSAFVRAGIVLLLVAAGFGVYALVSRVGDKKEAERAAQAPVRVVQLDVLNGCGAKGVSAKFTSFLRSRGYDVVEMKNYKSFNVHQTLIIDRVGDLASARHVAATLGLSEDRVIQQLNPDYYVDVSVIIGSDYPTLRSEN